jgi:chromosome segregation ATPase
LAESEKREKILKQEIERAQQEIATQEKIIERLKDDIKREGREKQKLLQYKTTKSKRLDELESKAREFEVLSSVNLGKILSMLESKERKINDLQKNDNNIQEYINAIGGINKQEMKQVKRQANEETKFKMEAMTKLESLRQELQMIQGNDQVSVNFWKEQCQSLFEICKNLKEDNENLVDNLGNLSEALSNQANVHPLDQFTNNQDLLQYLN